MNIIKLLIIIVKHLTQESHHFKDLSLLNHYCLHLTSYQINFLKQNQVHPSLILHTLSYNTNFLALVIRLFLETHFYIHQKSFDTLFGWPLRTY